jgi:hypothetical protein
MLKRVTFVICLMLIFVFTSVYSQVSMHGGKGLYRVLSAEPVNPTDIFVSGTFSSYFIKTGPETMAKYYSAHLNTTVGLAKYLEVFVDIVPYQDDQYHLLGRFGDTHLALKYLTPLATDAFKIGIMGFYKFPTAVSANVRYEVFSTDKPGWGARGLATLDLINVMPSFPTKLDLNLGYIDHNIYDQYFNSKIDQLFFGAGVKTSIRSVQAYVEYSGEIFFNNPSQVDFKQNSIRITPGFRFMGPWRNTIDFAFDIALTSYDSLNNTTPFHKEYSKWRATIGITHHFSVFKYFDKTARLERQKQLEEMRKLEEIRKKRERANQDLDKMKDILEKKKTEKK